jgi:CheY-like chemotaxis protein
MAKIILAEDDEDMRRFLVKALEKAGHDVTSFGEGASAFEEIKQTSFDLLLTDIVMPEMDGIELARRASELDPSLRSCSSPALPPLPCIRIPRLPKMPRSCPSRFTCATSSMKSSG